VKTSDDGWLLDDQGRVVLLRGVNFGGNSKLPRVPDGATHRLEGLFDPANVSFVGRPCPLDEAGEHFARLRHWGLRTLRLVVTWEAIEHAGPGRYDAAYLDYLDALVAVAAEHGLSVFVDPHQDVWSRSTGGDGAPAWTLEAVGLVPTHLHAVGAAFLHQEHGDPLPQMIWPTNYQKLACATMFSLFWAGARLAPSLRIDGLDAQEFLQCHYLGAVTQLVRTLAHHRSVLGFGSMNEPSAGWVGVGDIGERSRVPLQLGPSPTVLESLAAGAGACIDVDQFTVGADGPALTGRARLNPRRLSAWDARGCPWQREGIYRLDGDRPTALQPKHFASVDFLRDGLEPFVTRFAATVRALSPSALLFVEGEPFGACPRLDLPSVIHAGHWYDGMALFMKSFRPDFSVDIETKRAVLGRSQVAAMFAAQLGGLKERTRAAMPSAPLVVGEYGVPFDLAGQRPPRYPMSEEALGMYVDAIDTHLVGSTVWNYTPDHSHRRGDGWNGEDLSIFAPEDVAATRDGGRGLQGLMRPHPAATAGTPIGLRWDRKQRHFEYTYQATLEVPTVIEVPRALYPDGFDAVSEEAEIQRVSDDEVHVMGQGKVVVRITPSEPR